MSATGMTSSFPSLPHSAVSGELKSMLPSAVLTTPGSTNRSSPASMLTSEERGKRYAHPFANPFPVTAPPAPLEPIPAAPTDTTDTTSPSESDDQLPLLSATIDSFLVSRIENNKEEMKKKIQKIRKIAFGLRRRHLCANSSHQLTISSITNALNPHRHNCRFRDIAPVCTAPIVPATCRPYREKRRRHSHSGNGRGRTLCVEHMLHDCIHGTQCVSKDFTAAERSDAIDYIARTKPFCKRRRTHDDTTGFLAGPPAFYPIQRQVDPFAVAGGIHLIRDVHNRLGHALKDSSIISADLTQLHSLGIPPATHTRNIDRLCVHKPDNLIASVETLPSPVDQLVSLIKQKGTSKATIEKIIRIVAAEHESVNTTQAKAVAKHARLHVTPPAVREIAETIRRMKLTTRKQRERKLKIARDAKPIALIDTWNGLSSVLIEALRGCTDAPTITEKILGALKVPVVILGRFKNWLCGIVGDFTLFSASTRVTSFLQHVFEKTMNFAREIFANAGMMHAIIAILILGFLVCKFIPRLSGVTGVFEAIAAKITDCLSGLPRLAQFAVSLVGVILAGVGLKKSAALVCNAIATSDGEFIATEEPEEPTTWYDSMLSSFPISEETITKPAWSFTTALFSCLSGIETRVADFGKAHGGFLTTLKLLGLGITIPSVIGFCVKFVVDWVTDNISSYRDAFSPAQLTNEIAAWAREAKQLIVSQDAVNVSTDKTAVKRVLDFAERGNRLNDRVLALGTNHASFRSLSLVMTTALGTIRDIASIAARSKHAPCARPEPVCVSVSGPAQQGKTVFAENFMRDYAAIVHSDTFGTGNYKFTARLPVKYWEEYHGGGVTIIDDCLNNAKEDAVDSFHDIMIGCVNTADCPLESGTAAAKGTLFWHDSLLMITGNKDPFSNAAVLKRFDDKSALLRRCHFRVTLKPRAMFALAADPNRIDPAKTRLLQTPAEKRNVCEIVYQTWNGTALDDAVTVDYETFLQIVLDRTLQHQDDHEKRVENDMEFGEVAFASPERIAHWLTTDEDLLRHDQALRMLYTGLTTGNRVPLRSNRTAALFTAKRLAKELGLDIAKYTAAITASPEIATRLYVLASLETNLPPVASLFRRTIDWATSHCVNVKKTVCDLGVRILDMCIGHLGNIGEVFTNITGLTVSEALYGSLMLLRDFLFQPVIGVGVSIYLGASGVLSRVLGALTFCSSSVISAASDLSWLQRLVFIGLPALAALKMVGAGDVTKAPAEIGSLLANFVTLCRRMTTVPRALWSTIRSQLSEGQDIYFKAKGWVPIHFPAYFSDADAFTAACNAKPISDSTASNVSERYDHRDRHRRRGNRRGDDDDDDRRHGSYIAGSNDELPPVKQFHKKLRKQTVKISLDYDNNKRVRGRGIISGRTLITACHVWKPETNKHDTSTKDARLTNVSLETEGMSVITLTPEQYDNARYYRPDHDDLVYVDLSEVPSLDHAFPCLKKYVTSADKLVMTARDFSHFEPGLEQELIYEGTDIRICIDDPTRLVEILAFFGNGPYGLSGSPVFSFCQKNQEQVLLGILTASDDPTGNQKSRLVVTAIRSDHFDFPDSVPIARTSTLIAPAEDLFDYPKLIPDSIFTNFHQFNGHFPDDDEIFDLANQQQALPPARYCRYARERVAVLRSGLINCYLTQEKRRRLNTKTKIVQSPFVHTNASCHPDNALPWTCNVTQAQLSSPRTDVLAAMIRPQLEHRPPSVSIENDINFSEAVEDVRSDLHELLTRRRIRHQQTTIKEVIRGSLTRYHMPSHPTKTSAGYPYVAFGYLKGRAKDKVNLLKDFFNESDCINTKSDLWLDLRDFCEAALADTLPSEYPFLATLKDETRPIAKAHKPRVFTAWSVVAVLVTNIIFGGARAVLEEVCADSFAAIGINPHGPSWIRLARRLNPDGESRAFIAGDYSAYDKKMPPVVMKAAFDILCDIIDRDDGLQRLPIQHLDDLSRLFGLMPHTTDHTHLAAAMRAARKGVIRGIIYPGIILSMHKVYPRCGNPSGHPLTTVINSICNAIIIQTTLRTISVTHLELPPCAAIRTILRDHVAITTYGDDNVISISKKAYNGRLLEAFTLQNFQEVIGRVFKLDYTDADKTLGTKSHRTWDEVVFLKRRFPHPDRCFVHVGQAPLEREVIEQMIFHFKPRPGQYVDSFNDVLKAAELEAVMLGPEGYTRFAKPVNRMLGNFSKDRYDHPATGVVAHHSHELRRFRTYQAALLAAIHTPTAEYLRDYENPPLEESGLLPPPPYALYRDD